MINDFKSFIECIYKTADRILLLDDIPYNPGDESEDKIYLTEINGEGVVIVTSDCKFVQTDSTKVNVSAADSSWGYDVEFFDKVEI